MPDIEINETKNSLEIAEVWKFAAAIGISCALSFCGSWMTHMNQYTTIEDVDKIVATNQETLNMEIKHSAESILSLIHI